MANRVFTLEEVKSALEQFESQNQSNFLSIENQLTDIYIIIPREQNEE